MRKMSGPAGTALVLLVLATMLSCHKTHEFDSAPSAPSMPAGPSSGACDSLYRFTTSANDPDFDSVAFRFDWGDGDTSGWTGFVASGESAGAEHAWYYARACSVKAQARDVHGALSDWSEPGAMELRSGPRFADTVVARIPVEGGPTGIAALPSGEYLYVTCYDDDAVRVIRTSDNSVVQTIPVGQGPWGVAASPDGQYVYVANNAGWDGSMSVIRTSDNVVVDTVEVGGEPTELAVSPDGRYVYVSGAGYGQVSVVRTSDDSLVALVDVGDSPYGIAVMPDGKHVAVALYEEDVLCLFDTDSFTVTDRVVVGYGPQGVAVAELNQRVYVSVEEDYNSERSGVCSVTLPDFELSDSVIGFGGEDYPSAIALSPEENFLYVLFWEAEAPWMAVIGTRKQQVIGYVSDFGLGSLGGEGLVCLPNGLVYVANEYEDCVSVFGFSSGTSRNSCFRPYRGER